MKSTALRTILSTVNVQNFYFVEYLTLTIPDQLLCLYFAQNDIFHVNQVLACWTSCLLTILSTLYVRNCAGGGKVPFDDVFLHENPCFLHLATFLCRAIKTI